MVVEHLAVQRREELAEAHIFLCRDLLQSVPERHLEANRRAVPTNSQRSRLRFVVALRLVREQMAHGDPPGTFSFFPTIYLLAWRNNDPMAATANGQVRDPKFNLFNIVDH